MGTETHRLQHYYNLLPQGQVKLNNPLMGTETVILLVSAYPSRYSIVKLNNPLMGTETKATPLEKTEGFGPLN